MTNSESFADKVFSDLIAHIRKNENGEYYQPHSLQKHLTGTAKLCVKFAEVFGLSKLAEILGLTHDLGKASHAFQERIRIKTGFDAEEAHLEGKTAKQVDHSTAGAQFNIKKYGEQASILLAYIVAGHHAGLPDGVGEFESVLSQRLKKKVEDYSDILKWLEKQLPEKLEPKDYKPKKLNTSFNLRADFMVRMLFSALTDADFLDTESYMDPDRAGKRNNQTITIKNLKDQLNIYLEKFNDQKPTPIIQKRRQILGWCQKAALIDPGIFSLTVPTGGGKTLSSMAFALAHAEKHNLRRIIYVIPYTTIIEQNAKVFRDVFDSLDKNIVLEHHSNTKYAQETEDRSVLQRLAAENWEAKIIVTTNVQFFESFYANRSSSCRKLHNTAESVIVFDEAQMLPREYLAPCLAVVNELVNHYGCSAVMCTATQPSLHKSDKLSFGLENVKEIIPDPDKLFKSLKRTQIIKLEFEDTIRELTDTMKMYNQALCIVNTRKDARLIFEELKLATCDESCFHLSTLMCPDHRSDVFKTIRDLLLNGDNCRVISTQLIEAGVDIDFPVVFRAMAGLDSIAQAAGRCNREGKLEETDVFIFEMEKPPPPGHLRQSYESGKIAYALHSHDVLSPQAITTYFNDYYDKENRHFDKENILDKCKQNINAIPFKEIAHKFRLIDQVQYPVIVPFNDWEMEHLRKEILKFKYKFFPGDFRRILQGLTVQLHERPFIKLLKGRVIEDIFGDGRCYLLINPDIYNKDTGLNPDIPEFLEIESTIL